jgi:hypothetical protein
MLNLRDIGCVCVTAICAVIGCGSEAPYGDGGGQGGQGAVPAIGSVWQAVGYGGTVSHGGTSACGNPTPYYRDYDGDGYGDPLGRVLACGPAPAGFVSNSLDCCDFDPGAKPGVSSWHSSVNACGSEDWNCDNVVTRSYPNLFSKCVSPTSTGWINTASVPACGVTGWYVTSCADSGYPPYTPYPVVTQKVQHCM